MIINTKRYLPQSFWRIVSKLVLIWYVLFHRASEENVKLCRPLESLSTFEFLLRILK
jgi:hypothetical protein